MNETKWINEHNDKLKHEDNDKDIEKLKIYDHIPEMRDQVTDTLIMSAVSFIHYWKYIIIIILAQSWIGGKGSLPYQSLVKSGNFPAIPDFKLLNPFFTDFWGREGETTI